MTRRRDPDRVPVAPLRDAYLASSLTLTEVCVSLGWFRESPSKGGPYTSQLARALGLRATKNVNHNTGVVYCSTQLHDQQGPGTGDLRSAGRGLRRALRGQVAVAEGAWWSVRDVRRVVGSSGRDADVRFLLGGV